jgi:Domain of unknown function (DUF4205)
MLCTVYELLSQDEPATTRQQQRGSNVAVPNRLNSTSTAVTTSSTGSALSRSDAAALRCLLFGDARKSFAASWTQQGLVFNKSNSSSTTTSSSKAKQYSNNSSSDLAYGLVQHDGGPCGPIAVVQALFLDYLLYSGQSTAVTNGICSDRCSDDWMLPDRAQQQSGLIAVLTAVLWRAGSGSKCTLCLCRCVHSDLVTDTHTLHAL